MKSQPHASICPVTALFMSSQETASICPEASSAYLFMDQAMDNRRLFRGAKMPCVPDNLMDIHRSFSPMVFAVSRSHVVRG